MKSIVRIHFLLFLVTLLSGCTNDNWVCKNGDGPVKQRTFNVDRFSKIEIAISGNVQLIKAQKHTITIDAQENLFQHIKLQKNGEKLTIKSDRCFRSYKTIQMTVRASSLNGIGISGSADIYSNDTLDNNQTRLKISGSGDIDVPVKGDELETSISGSGDIDLTGEVDNHSLDISGSGDIQAFGLITDQTQVKISGSGDVKVYVRDHLKVDILGSGSVYYKGNPQIEKSVNGSGELINAN